MAITPVAAMPYPNVPLSPGVPIVQRQPGITPAILPALLFADEIQLLGALLAPPWGLFTVDGAPIGIPDSFVGVEFRRDARLSTYQMEQGAFQSYDKIQLPYDVRVTFSVFTSLDARASFLEAVDSVQQSLQLCTVVTPEATYVNVNLVHYDYRRETRGSISMLLIDVWLEQVRITAQAQFANSQSAQGTAQQDGGTAQTAVPASTQVVPSFDKMSNNF